MAGTSAGFLPWYLNLDLNPVGVKSAFSAWLRAVLDGSSKFKGESP
jgi:hypothetical protein